MLKIYCSYKNIGLSMMYRKSYKWAYCWFSFASLIN